MADIENPFITNISVLSVSAILDPKYKKKYDNKTLSGSLKEELKDVVEEAIKNWDIRQYNGLMNVFPKLFPKTVTGINLTDQGWEIY